MERIKEPMIKAAFFDIDGTILSHTQRKIPDSTRKAIHMMQEKGIKVYIATGRHAIEIDEVDFEDLHFDGYIALNGSLLLDEKGNVEKHIHLAEEDKEVLVQLFNESKYAVLLVTMNELYLNKITPFALELCAQLNLEMPKIKPWKDQEILGATAYFTVDEEDEFKSLLSDNVIAARWNPFGVDIAPLCREQKELHLEGKPYGLYLMGQKHGFTQDEMIAFGDSQNDESMLRYAAIGVAMGNATQGAKDAADYVTDHIDEHGIWNAAVHFGLIKGKKL